MKKRCTLATILLLTLGGFTADAADKLKVLIVDGQNNHDWKGCTPVMKAALEDCGRFTVDVTTTPAPLSAPRAPKKDATPEQKEAYAATLAKFMAAQEKTRAQWQAWRPKFASYDVVLCNYTGDDWPKEVCADFTRYVQEGGGLVIVHAADNAFPQWPEFNEMIGVGGWGGRNEKSGPMLYWADGAIVRDNSPGAGGTHGAQHEFVVETRDPEHPIMKGLPPRWKHVTDELYSKLRGPAKNLTVLATAYAARETGGTGKNEPILMTISYGKGRVFHTVLGHDPNTMRGVGFQVTLQRGTEWAATGAVTLPPPKPEDMLADKAIRRPSAK